MNVPNDKNFFGLHFAALISIQWKEILLKEHFYFHAPALSCYIHEDACYKTTRIPNWQKKKLTKMQVKKRDCLFRNDVLLEPRGLNANSESLYGVEKINPKLWHFMSH